MKRRILAVWLTLVMLSGLFTCAVSAASDDMQRPRDAHIAFGADGKLRILQIADIQDDADFGEAPQNLLRASVEKIKPDLIVLTGDNIAGYKCPTREDAETAIRCFMDILEEYKIPVAAVFGNHDDDTTPMTKEEQMDLYMSYDCFIGCKGVIASKTVEGRTMTNVGTYNIPIYDAPDSDKVVYNVWCFDSGRSNPDPAYGGYGYVLDEQVDWYVRTSEALQDANGGALVPSIAFQHIAPPQIYTALKKVSVWLPGAVRHDGYYYVLPSGVSRLTNWMGEAPCPPETDFADGYRQVDAMVERGDVQAVFYGHDHVNHYVVPYKGIDLVSSAGFTYDAYNDVHRGFRLISLDKNDLGTYASTYYSAARLLGVRWLRPTLTAFVQKVWGWVRDWLTNLIKR